MHNLPFAAGTMYATCPACSLAVARPMLHAPSTTTDWKSFALSKVPSPCGYEPMITCEGTFCLLSSLPSHSTALSRAACREDLLLMHPEPIPQWAMRLKVAQV